MIDWKKAFEDLLCDVEQEICQHIDENGDFWGDFTWEDIVRNIMKILSEYHNFDEYL